MITGGKYTGGKAVALQGGDKTPSMVIASVELGREGGSQEEFGLVYLVEQRVPLCGYRPYPNICQPGWDPLSCDLSRPIRGRWEILTWRPVRTNPPALAEF